MLNLSFAGTLGADPETRQTASNTVTEFRVAVNGYDRRAKAKTTTWLKVAIWGKRGEQLAGLASKGSKVAGSGVFEVQTYTNRDGVEKVSYVVNCQDLTLQSFVEREAEPAQKKGKPAQAADFPDDDEIPF
jgi:single-strand DNA-binding protein